MMNPSRRLSSLSDKMGRRSAGMLYFSEVSRCSQICMIFFELAWISTFWWWERHWSQFLVWMFWAISTHIWWFLRAPGVEKMLRASKIVLMYYIYSFSVQWCLLSLTDFLGMKKIDIGEINKIDCGDFPPLAHWWLNNLSGKILGQTKK